jgi:hypothetical protein
MGLQVSVCIANRTGGQEKELTRNRKLIAGLQSKLSGSLECLAWHFFEIGELLPLGLPTGAINQAQLADAIEVSERIRLFSSSRCC